MCGKCESFVHEFVGMGADCVTGTIGRLLDCSQNPSLKRIVNALYYTNKTIRFDEGELMGNRISTAEAARRLSVSVRRVQELVKSGMLDAEKVSGVWLVEEEAVERRARTVNKAGGRPPRGMGAYEEAFMLMNRGHEIVEVIYDTRRREFTSMGELFDELRAPVGIAPFGMPVTIADFNRWWRGRGIPGMRNGIDLLLREAGVEVPEELLRRNLGLSLSDQYWIRPDKSGLEWAEVNFFNNDFDDIDARTVPYALDPNVHARPENTSDGNLEKIWVVRDGVRMLRKGGLHNNQEPYNEVVATALHRRILQQGDYVEYGLEETGLSAYSLCANFLSDEEEYVPALYVERVLGASGGGGAYDHYLECCDMLGAQGVAESLNHMIVCDDILANSDRHFRNFGLVRNVETLEWRPAPIFDSGSCLWCDTDQAVLERGERSFVSKQFDANPGRQLLLVNDFSWLRPSDFRGFVDEAIEILSRNGALDRRLPFVRSALEWRIRRVLDIAEWS